MYLTQIYQLKQASIRRVLVHVYMVVSGALQISSELK
jgi:hypothetical protein